MRRTGSQIAPSRITVRDLQRKIEVNIPGLQKFAENAWTLCLKLRRNQRTQLTRLGHVSILLISDRRMIELHRQFLNEAGSTDIITFAHGEIFISLRTAQRHARRFGNSLQRELQLYIVHGLLHLHGYDDRKKGDARKMSATQEKILVAALKSRARPTKRSPRRRV